ncbi:MAG: hypothetical protein ACRDR6_28075 [Pseudonocardiaceae bacterium]
MQTYVLTCIDLHVDPSDILGGLELGDATIARGIGSRVTDAVPADLT